jgi:PleD family two-component response regulator
VSERVFTSVPDRDRSRALPNAAAAAEEVLDIGIGDDILVVDDSPANLIAVDAALSSLGRKLVFARSGVEALGKLLDQDFALILLDVAMPGMTGIETARLIRSRERRSCS